MMFLLSQDEREYLNDIKNKKLRPATQAELEEAKKRMHKDKKREFKTPWSTQKERKQELQRRDNLRWKIRKKTRQSLKNLALVFETLTPTELKFFKEDYLNLAVPLLSAIERFNLNWFYEDVKTTYLTVALIRAGKRYDYKCLATNEKYRQRMIEWLVKNGIDFWTPPTLKKQKCQYEEIVRLTNKSVRKET
jgi:hypothetical protein